jgi:hypothetical protein
MSDVIRIRDVVRGEVLELGPSVQILRASYDMWHPAGPVAVMRGMAQWEEGESNHWCRTVPAPLGDTHPGERVLVRLGPLGEYFLCEVQAINGFTVD